jgi:glycosyltransferase involved in cell wall biosynthesis
LCADLGLVDRICFAGTIPHADIATWMTKSDLLVIPSRSEGFGIVALEAMASGIPVVATNVGGLKEIITAETGVLSEAVTPYAIAQAISKALRMPWDLKVLQQQARLYDWFSISSSIQKVYRFVLARANKG